MRILLIENQFDTDCSWKSEFNRNGHDIDIFDNFSCGERALAVIPYCAVILNITPLEPDVSRVLLRWRRKGFTAPVLVISHEGQPSGRGRVINAGADDCMEAPPDPMEMMARIGTIIRRQHAENSTVLRHGALTLDMDSREVRNGQQIIVLTSREIALLEILLINKTRVISKEFLESKMCAWHRNTSSNVVEVHISNLRRKIGKQLIRTIYRQGYTLRDQALAEHNTE